MEWPLCWRLFQIIRFGFLLQTCSTVHLDQGTSSREHRPPASAAAQEPRERHDFPSQCIALTFQNGGSAGSRINHIRRHTVHMTPSNKISCPLMPIITLWALHATLSGMQYAKCCPQLSTSPIQGTDTRGASSEREVSGVILGNWGLGNKYLGFLLQMQYIAAC